MRWEPIENFKHVVNNKYSVSENGDVRNNDTGKILHKKITNKGYYAVSLKTTSGQQWILVHQLVGTFFLPVFISIGEDIVPDHLDGDKLNNNYMNLEWKTRSDNIRAAFKLGLINNSGENNKSATISNDMAHKICKLLTEDKSYSEIISILNLPNNNASIQLLRGIKNKTKWRNISDQYDFDTSPRLNESCKEIVNNLDEIRNMINQGYRDYEIVDKLFPNAKSRKSKMMTISNIRKGKIYNK